MTNISMPIAILAITWVTYYIAFCMFQQSLKMTGSLRRTDKDLRRFAAICAICPAILFVFIFLVLGKFWTTLLIAIIPAAFLIVLAYRRLD